MPVASVCSLLLLLAFISCVSGIAVYTRDPAINASAEAGVAPVGAPLLSTSDRSLSAWIISSLYCVCGNS